MTRCHYGNEDLAANDALPVVGHPGEFTCAAHAMLAMQNTPTGDLMLLILALTEEARNDPRTFALRTMEHIAHGGSVTCLIAEMLLVGRKLNARELTMVVNEFIELGKREDAELRTKETTIHGHHRNH